MESKTKINKWNLITLIKFYTAKGNKQTKKKKKKKRKPTEWEKMLSNDDTDKRLSSKINKQFIQLNIKKINPMKK